MSAPIRLGVIANCQAQSLAIALGALLPDAEVIWFNVNDVAPDARAETAEILRGCTHVLTQDLAAGYGPLSTRALRAGPARLALLPPLRFGGYHPDEIMIAADGGHLRGPTGYAQSRLAAAAFLAGYAPAQAAALFNRLVFAKLGYLRAFAVQRDMLLAQYAAYGVDLAPGIAHWHVGGRFMHGVVHPSIRVALDLARIACALLGLTPTGAPDPATLPDPLLFFPRHPVLPPLAHALGIPPEQDFTPPGQETGLGLEAYLEASFATFEVAPRRALRQADGVAAALAVLGLRDALEPAPRRAAPAPDPAARVLLTWWGTKLCVEQGSRLLVQTRLIAAAAEATDLLLDARLVETPPKGPNPALGGAEIVAAPLPGLIALRRQGAYLSADPARYAPAFSAPRVESWELLLPVPQAIADLLGRLLGGAWRTDADGVLPPAVMGMESGFILRLGPHRVALRKHLPEALPDGTVRVVTAVGKLVLTPDAAESARDEAVAAPHAAPEEAGSPEEFMALPGRRLRLFGTRELIHLPLTVAQADREWVFRAYEYGARPPVGPQAKDLTLTRKRDQTVLLSRGFEGTVLDRDGVAKGLAFLEKPEVKLPDGVRRLAGLTLVDRALADGAGLTRIEGPVVVPYTADIQNYYHWLVEAALPLHLALPFLPRGCRLLLPGTISGFRGQPWSTFDHLRVLAALGFEGLQIIEPAEEAVRAEDVTFLDQYYSHEYPAAALASFRERAHAAQSPGPATKRLFIQRRKLRAVGYPKIVGKFLEQHGFETLYLENTPPETQIKLFAEAEFIVAPHGAALANLLYCRPGTRVLELCPEVTFRPYFWLIAEKLGLNYAVLPCRTEDGTFNGTLLPDLRKFRLLFTMLRDRPGFEDAA